MDEWVRLDRRIIDGAVKEWRKRLRACAAAEGGQFEHGVLTLTHNRKGRSTYEFIPVVGTKVLWPRKHDIGISYGRMRLHETMLKDDSYRTGTAESPICTSYTFAL